MAGGLLNIVSYGTSNILVYGNPKKSLFRNVYKSITNFGMQRFRLDTENENKINVDSETLHRFVLKRHADLIGDTYLSIDLPNVWSPVEVVKDNDGNITDYHPYEFQWVKELGTTMINDIEILAGGQLLAKYSGEYFAAVMHRDHVGNNELWNKMTGNIPELYDPANAFPKKYNSYPNAMYTNNVTSPESSIHGRRLLIPLDVFFSRTVSMALPLVSIQYMEVIVQIRLKPLRELFTIQIYNTVQEKYIRQAPLSNISMNTFFDIPRNEDQTGQENKLLNWNSDIHIMANYYFLNEEERKEFAKREHSILVKDVHRHKFSGVVGPYTAKVEMRGLVSSFMFRLRRSDAKERNEWTNYTNWTYEQPAWSLSDNSIVSQTTGEVIMMNNNSMASFEKERNIVKDMTLLCDGKFRENTLHESVFQYMEPYARSKANSKDGLYFYNFCANTDIQVYQPSGGMNMDKFENIELALSVIEPLRVENRKAVQICDENGDIIGISQNINDTFLYTYDLTVFEERYNVVHIRGGMIGMLYAR